MKLAISVKSLCGHIAMWAVRQSPYTAPDGLTDVILEFKRRVEPSAQSLSGWTYFETDEESGRKCLTDLLNLHLLTIPQVRQWNERKNGNQSPLGFVSRYDKPEPDNDFIDLDALTGNIVMSAMKEAREQS